MASGTIVNNNSTGSSNSLKLPDGTFIQWGLVSVTTNASTSSAFKYKGQSTVTFDEPFTTVPYVVTNVRDNAAYWNSEHASTTTTSVEINVGGNTNNATKSADWIAVGRWK